MPRTLGQSNKYLHHSYRSGQPAAARPRTGGGGPEVGLVTTPLLLGTPYLPLCRDRYPWPSAASPSITGAAPPWRSPSGRTDGMAAAVGDRCPKGHHAVPEVVPRGSGLVAARR